MCGILGFTGRKNLSRTRQLLSEIKYRGYDDEAICYAAGLNFGMNRLAINDLTRGYYPMVYKQYQLIFNGEIYNYPDIKKQLEKKGVAFNTKCDAEIILPLFSLYGEKSLSMLEGMFAICIVDTKKNEVTLARDKVGEKPLYYLHTNQQFAFSSELKTLLSFQNSPQLNQNSLASYLRHGSVFSKKTLACGIEKILPAHALVFKLKNQTFTVRRYWQPRIKTIYNQSLDSSISVLGALLSDSVRAELLSDVPVGCFLSGGVDSSLITYFARQHVSNLKTYAVAFPDSRKDNESFFARQVSKHLQTEHTEIECRADNVRPFIDQIGKLIDEPICDPAVLPTYLISQEARKSVKVILTGDGGDELFGGYYRYYRYYLIKKMDVFPKWFSRGRELPFFSIRHRLAEKLLHIGINYSPQNVWSQKELESLLLTSLNTVPNYVPEAIAADNILLGLQLSDYRGYLPEQLLMKMDKMTMLNNLEARAPFLNSRLINFGLSLPSTYKFNGLHSKYLLRKLAARHFPVGWSWRPKHGFSVPLGRWFTNELRDVVYDSITALDQYDDLFNMKYIQAIVDEHMCGLSMNKNKIWSLIVLSKWLQNYKIQLSK